MRKILLIAAASAFAVSVADAAANGKSQREQVTAGKTKVTPGFYPGICAHRNLVIVNECRKRYGQPPIIR